MYEVVEALQKLARKCSNLRLGLSRQSQFTPLSVLPPLPPAQARYSRWYRQEFHDITWQTFRPYAIHAVSVDYPHRSTYGQPKNLCQITIDHYQDPHTCNQVHFAWQSSIYSPFNDLTQVLLNNSTRDSKLFKLMGLEGPLMFFIIVRINLFMFGSKFIHTVIPRALWSI